MSGSCCASCRRVEHGKPPWQPSLPNEPDRDKLDGAMPGPGGKTDGSYLPRVTVTVRRNAAARYARKDWARYETLLRMQGMPVATVYEASAGIWWTEDGALGLRECDVMATEKLDFDGEEP